MLRSVSSCAIYSLFWRPSRQPVARDGLRHTPVGRLLVPSAGRRGGSGEAPGSSRYALGSARALKRYPPVRLSSQMLDSSANAEGKTVFAPRVVAATSRSCASPDDAWRAEATPIPQSHRSSAPRSAHRAPTLAARRQTPRGRTPRLNPQTAPCRWPMQRRQTPGKARMSSMAARADWGQAGAQLRSMPVSRFQTNGTEKLPPGSMRLPHTVLHA